jgi:hypothetical protein
MQKCCVRRSWKSICDAPAPPHKLIVPQIRSLGLRIENKGEFLKPALEMGVNGLAAGLQTVRAWLWGKLDNHFITGRHHPRGLRAFGGRPALGIAPVLLSGSTAYPPIAAASVRSPVRRSKQGCHGRSGSVIMNSYRFRRRAVATTSDIEALHDVDPHPIQHRHVDRVAHLFPPGLGFQSMLKSWAMKAGGPLVYPQNRLGVMPCHWARPRTFNACTKGIARKPMFREAFRCSR